MPSFVSAVCESKACCSCYISCAGFTRLFNACPQGHATRGCGKNLARVGLNRFPSVRRQGFRKREGRPRQNLLVRPRRLEWRLPGLARGSHRALPGRALWPPERGAKKNMKKVKKKFGVVAKVSIFAVPNGKEGIRRGRVLGEVDWNTGRQEHKDRDEDSFEGGTS